MANASAYMGTEAGNQNLKKPDRARQCLTDCLISRRSIKFLMAYRLIDASLQFVFMYI